MESERCLRGLVADSGRASHRSESTGWFIASCEMSCEQFVMGKKGKHAYSGGDTVLEGETCGISYIEALAFVGELCGKSVEIAVLFVVCERKGCGVLWKGGYSQSCPSRRPRAAGWLILGRPGWGRGNPGEAGQRSLWAMGLFDCGSR